MISLSNVECSGNRVKNNQHVPVRAITEKIISTKKTNDELTNF